MLYQVLVVQLNSRHAEQKRVLENANSLLKSLAII